MEHQHAQITVLNDIKRDEFLSKVYPKREPVILRGLDIGPCTQKWTVPYLALTGGKKEVKLHVSSVCQMNFIDKNFIYRSLPFNEFVERASREENTQYFIDSTEKYYLRALGDDPRNDVANIANHFADLSADVRIPEYYEDSQFFSSVFRIASKGTQLWTHYDVMDNLLIQVIGRKKVVLFAPKDVDYLYMSGDKSRILDVDSPDLLKFPKFAQARRVEGYLEPGDVLFIPALWFHNMTYVDFGVAVNVFWRHLDAKFYDTKDPYGNKDLLPAQRATQIVDRALKALEELPEEYQDFYARRLCDRIRSKACKDAEDNR
ncbi:tRNA wybutosine-synthesizing protein 5 [Plakobranchus ocellatus]|uniref:tRNA wybutosine-synthesizing protein 5 n=1 Tax=Plakobranchus ocellatus TaxID=259542 RepID=A0AAV4AST5_9GAST|nr:tRNA wybutosine-synthesizing protein 5 [Plakobranchus ocellatus]